MWDIIDRMDPQQHTPQPITTTHYAPAPEAPAPKKKKRWLIPVLVVAGLVILGAIASQFGSKPASLTYSRDGDGQLGALKAGTFNYINACEVFTAADLDTITGKTSNRQEVEATFALKTYNTDDPQRSYTSSCGRWDDNGALTANHMRVTITNFSYPALQAKDRALISHGGYATDSSLKSQFGPQAEYSSTVSDLRFEVDNKRVSVVPNYPGDAAKSRTVATKIAAAVVAKLKTAAAQPSKVLAYAPAGQKVGPFPYLSTCQLWGANDYRTLLKMEPDESEVGTIYAESVLTGPAENKVNGECKIITKPSKMELNSGDLSSLDDPKVTVAVHTVQYDAIDDAQYYFGANVASSFQPFSGVGDEAMLSRTTGAAGLTQTLRIRRNNVVIEINTSRFKDAVVDADTDLAQLQQIATTILGRM